MNKDNSIINIEFFTFLEVLHSYSENVNSTGSKYFTSNKGRVDRLKLFELYRDNKTYVDSVLSSENINITENYRRPIMSLVTSSKYEEAFEGLEKLNSILTKSFKTTRDIYDRRFDQIRRDLRTLIHNVLSSAYGDNYFELEKHETVYNQLKGLMQQSNKKINKETSTDSLKLINTADASQLSKLVFLNEEIFMDIFKLNEERNKLEFKNLIDLRNELKHEHDMEKWRNPLFFFRSSAALVYFQSTIESYKYNKVSKT